MDRQRKRRDVPFCFLYLHLCKSLKMKKNGNVHLYGISEGSKSIIFHCLSVFVVDTLLTVPISGVPSGVGVFNPPPRKSEGHPQSCQTQPDCENC